VKSPTERPGKTDLKANLQHQTDTMRVFFALWPNCRIQQQLHAIAKQLQPQCQGRVMRIETLHMTLQFIGNIRRSDLPKLLTAASKVAAPPFTLALEKIAFWKHNRIAYATFNSHAPELDALVLALKTQLAAAGIVYADNNFSPHVTLMRNVEHKLQTQVFTAIEWQIASFVLVESKLTDQGAHYKILHQWPLSPTQPSLI
jgi:2'-5' RNA ligase